MPRRLSFVCDDELAERIEQLARRHGVSQQEALRQIVETGIAEIEDERRA